MSTYGYSGSNFDRFVEHTDMSTLHKMKETYWTTKQAVIKKFGKKEDEHVVASDSELDAKLEVFKAIRKSSMDLLYVIERYQDRLCSLAQEENAIGRFLKCHCSRDNTRAGKIMAAVGKSQSLSAQQRLTLRVPLVRLYQEVETFRYRAISDTLLTVNRMEGARTEYRGALLWMKKTSEELDPDTYKQLEKFRRVQAQVRRKKQRFDKLKLDVMQKVDLLSASRCNMFSSVLANYQSALLHFWKKTSCTMSAVADSFRGYQYYEFHMLTVRVLCRLQKPVASDFSIVYRELTDASRKLAEQAGPPVDNDNQDVPAETLLLEGDEADSVESTLLTNKDEESASVEGHGDFGPFMDFRDNDNAMNALEKELDRIQKLSGACKSTISNDLDLLTGTSDQTQASRGHQEVMDNDDLSFFNEILNAPSTGHDEFTQEWQTVFGLSSANMSSIRADPADDVSAPQKADFMPSSLMDIKLSTCGIDPGNSSEMNVANTEPCFERDSQNNSSAALKAGPKPIGGKVDRTAWFNLFADLDPLSNPDTIGRDAESTMEAL